MVRAYHRGGPRAYIVLRTRHVAKTNVSSPAVGIYAAWALASNTVATCASGICCPLFAGSFGCREWSLEVTRSAVSAFDYCGERIHRLKKLLVRFDIAEPIVADSSPHIPLEQFKIFRGRIGLPSGACTAAPFELERSGMVVSREATNGPTSLHLSFQKFFCAG